MAEKVAVGVRLPRALHNQLVELAKQRGITLNALLQERFEDEVARQELILVPDLTAKAK